MEFAIPAAALIIAAAALWMNRQSMVDLRRQAASQEYVQQLEKRIEECEQGRRELRDDNRQMRIKVDQGREREMELRVEVLELGKRLDLALEGGKA